MSTKSTIYNSCWCCGAPMTATLNHHVCGACLNDSHYNSKFAEKVARAMHFPVWPDADAPKDLIQTAIDFYKEEISRLEKIKQTID